MGLLPGGHSSTVGATLRSVLVPLCHQCHPGVLSAFRRTDSSADMPSYSSLWLPRWRRAVWWKKQIWQVNWELSQESCRECWVTPALSRKLLTISHLQLVVAGDGWWCTELSVSGCTTWNMLSFHSYQSCLCSVLNVFECPFSLWLCKSVSAEKIVQVYRMYMYRIVLKVS